MCSYVKYSEQALVFIFSFFLKYGFLQIICIVVSFSASDYNCPQPIL